MDKEQYKRELLSAYSRINLLKESEQVSCSQELDKFIIKYGCPEGIFKCLEKCNEDILFVQYSQLIKFCEPKEALLRLLKSLTQSEITLYLMSEEKVYDELNEHLLQLVNFAVKEVECLWDKYIDDGYVLIISDQREMSVHKLDYVKIYPNGVAIVVIEKGYNIYRCKQWIDERQMTEISNYVCRIIEERKKDYKRLIIDDRCFMGSYEITYGLKWLGYSEEKMRIDIKDYFLNDDCAAVIKSIMKMPYIDKYFVWKGE